MIMTPMPRLLLLPLLIFIATAKDLEEKKGPFQNTQLQVQEGTPVLYPLHQFQVTHPGVTGFRLSGEGTEDISMSNDGWLYLDKPLDWSRDDNYLIMVEALAGTEVVGDPIYVTIDVLDINNNAPYFEQNAYTTEIREHSQPGVPFIRVSASDRDDPTTPNAQLNYSLISQIPNRHNKPLFQINAETGEISTTAEGTKIIRARESILSRQGDDNDIDYLKRSFDTFCPTKTIPYEDNPFFTCVERAEVSRRNVDPLEDPDYTLIVRAQDLGGMSENSLSGTTRVHIAVLSNRWVSPGSITVRENLEETYPMVITKVQANEPGAVYTLVQKEREVKFPFQIEENGEILLMEQLDREEKDMYILVVMASDSHGREMERPMEIQVLVGDENDNKPVCENEHNIFEVQEDEPVGSEVGQLLAHDDDEEGTLNSQLTYAIESQIPLTAPLHFSIDAASGRIQALRSLQRKEQQLYNLVVKVSDSDFSTECQVIIKVIDINNELPLFEKSDYGTFTLAEDTPVGHTVLDIRATDADDPDSGSSFIEFHISAGNENDFFSVETDGKGNGHVVIAKPLDFETSSTYKLQIDARNPEPLMKGMEYGSDSTTFVSVSLTDVDEPPEFYINIHELTVLEDTKKGSVLLTVEAADPEGNEIGFKLDGDTKGWLEIDAATGQIKTKHELDRETQETFDITVTAFEKAHPEKSSEHVLSVRLLDVNDNSPRLTENNAFICVKKLEPVLIRASDADSAPYSQPFTFTLEKEMKYPHWKLVPVDGTSAKLSLRKVPTKEMTFNLPINIKDNAGMGVTQQLSVKVCNCTELGYCYIPPTERNHVYGMGPTIGILAGVLGLCIILFVIVVKRIKKQNKKRAQLTAAEEEKNAMM